ncbi:uncharacterized protein YALI1_D09285g [Yarrowia lipolytica]|uniref:Uncharacterized protein n=1 Tax=Yarrowia lipolytica TaxID=4952 RepID=A0A1D8NDK1_YARLL|nr:hypothetical protein YALI1_D09285g [Yarrowia lipolytica]
MADGVKRSETELNRVGQIKRTSNSQSDKQLLPSSNSLNRHTPSVQLPAPLQLISSSPRPTSPSRLVQLHHLASPNSTPVAQKHKSKPWPSQPKRAVGLLRLVKTRRLGYKLPAPSPPGNRLWDLTSDNTEEGSPPDWRECIEPALKRRRRIANQRQTQTQTQSQTQTQTQT